MISLSSSDSCGNLIEYPNNRLEKKLPGRPRNLHKIAKKKSGMTYYLFITIVKFVSRFLKLLVHSDNDNILNSKY